MWMNAAEEEGWRAYTIMHTLFRDLSLSILGLSLLHSHIPPPPPSLQYAHAHDPQPPALETSRCSVSSLSSHISRGSLPASPAREHSRRQISELRSHSPSLLSTSTYTYTPCSTSSSLAGACEPAGVVTAGSRVCAHSPPFPTFPSPSSLSCPALPDHCADWLCGPRAGVPREGEGGREGRGRRKEGGRARWQ